MSASHSAEHVPPPERPYNYERYTDEFSYFSAVKASELEQLAAPSPAPEPLLEVAASTVNLGSNSVDADELSASATQTTQTPENRYIGTEAAPELAGSADNEALFEEPISEQQPLPGDLNKVDDTEPAPPTARANTQEERTPEDRQTGGTPPPQVSRALTPRGTSGSTEASGAPSTMAETMQVEPGSAPPQAAADYVLSSPVVVVNGDELGAVPLRQAGERSISIHLRSFLSIFESRMRAADFHRLINASSADQFVTLDELRTAGFDVQYDQSRQRLLIANK